MKKFKPIRPLRGRCDCGKLVKNHHWLCDRCWGEKAKIEYIKRKKGLYKPRKKKIRDNWITRLISK